MATQEDSKSDTLKENIDKKDFDSMRSYALYEYITNRPKNKSDTDTAADINMQNESIESDDHSLSVLAASISTDSETELRKFISKRLSRGTVYSGTGNIAVIDFGLSEDSEPVACYYCLLRPVGQDLEKPKNYSSSSSKDYVVCFVTHAEDNTLELFRADLDEYSAKLLNNLQKKAFNNNTKEYLEDWYKTSVEYVMRCVMTLGQDIRYLINVTLTNAELKIIGGNDQLQSDIKRFVDCCSLSELLNQAQTDVNTPDKLPASDLLLIDVSTQLQQTERQREIITLTIEEDTFEFSNTDCTEFCQEWSNALHSPKVSKAVQMRQIIDNYRLKEINFMNTLKRLILQAENDHYSLYRAFTFLKTCGNGKILLQHAKLDHTTGSLDAKNVLKVLEEYITETDAL